MGKGSALSRIESVEAGSSDAGEQYSQNAVEEHKKFSSYRPGLCLVGSHPSNFVLEIGFMEDSCSFVDKSSSCYQLFLK